MTGYTIGVDFGSLSARAVIVRVADGKEIATAEYAYPHGVMTEADICAAMRSKDTTALQHPSDYTEALGHSVREAMRLSGLENSEIRALAIDFTASNILPTLKDGTPLCTLEEFKSEPHAYVKMWKHHGASAEAAMLTEAANSISPELLERFSGVISSEWCYPKILETLRCAPEVYERAECFIEAGDWIVKMLTGESRRSACLAGYKAQWTKENGYPGKEMFTKIDERLGNLVDVKLSGDVIGLGECAGLLNEYGSKLTSLPVGTPVATALIDAHTALPAAGAVSPGDLMIIMGTSACHILISDRDHAVRGVCGRVLGGVVPGYYAYEAGQSAVGDALGWVVNNCVPASYLSEAKDRGISIFDLLNERASKFAPGECGLIALDWWNGNRSPFADYDLSGLILGITLTTPPEAIYRAVIEAIAFGARRIAEEFAAADVPVKRIIVSGGIAKKNPFIMQILSDVLGRRIEVSALTQSGARGSAIYAAVAAGAYPSVTDAAAIMCERGIREYLPNAANTSKYNDMYAEYIKLSDYFHSENRIMKKLKDWQK